MSKEEIMHYNICIICNKLKNTKRLTDSVCIACRIEGAGGSREQRTKAKLQGRLRAHNLTENQYREMIDESDSKCAICSKIFSDPTKLFIDHNHQTEKIRGLLCISCNSGLGLFGDSVERLQQAMNYLYKHSNEIDEPQEENL